MSALKLTEDGVPQLRYLPPQLQELTVSLDLQYDMFANQVVDVRDLSGLACLMASGDFPCAQGVVVGVARGVSDGRMTKLPPNCRHLSVADIESAQPLLEVKGYYFKTQQALQQLSSLSRLTDLQIGVNAVGMEEDFDIWATRMHQEVVEANRWQGLPPLRALTMWHMSSETDWTYLSAPLLRPRSLYSTLQRLIMQGIEFEHGNPSRLEDVFGSLQGLQSLWLSGCRIVADNHKAQLAGMVRAIARLPALRDLRLADLSWDAAASVALAAATQLTGLLFSTRSIFMPELTSLVGQVQQACGAA